jgi:hypothetical protein
MANHKANEERRLMKVPVSFHARVMAAAKKAGMDATVFMEKADVIYNG